MSNQFSFVCPQCKAEQHRPNESCWLCGLPWAESIPGESTQDNLPAGEPGLVAKEPESLSFSLATLFLIITLASVCMGLLVTVPGLGVFACIILVPVFFRTMRVVRYRESTGQEVSPAEKVVLFLGSFVVSSVLVAIVCVAAFCSFCGLCLAVVSLDGQVGALPYAFGICLLAVGTIFLSIRLFKWNRRRFRRDIGKE